MVFLDPGTMGRELEKAGWSGGVTGPAAESCGSFIRVEPLLPGVASSRPAKQGEHEEPQTGTGARAVPDILSRLEAFNTEWVLHFA